MLSECQVVEMTVEKATFRREDIEQVEVLLSV